MGYRSHRPCTSLAHEPSVQVVAPDTHLESPSPPPRVACRDRVMAMGGPSRAWSSLGGREYDLVLSRAMLSRATAPAAWHWGGFGVRVSHTRFVCTRGHTHARSAIVPHRAGGAGHPVAALGPPFRCVPVETTAYTYTTAAVNHYQEKPRSVAGTLTIDSYGSRKWQEPSNATLRVKL